MLLYAVVGIFVQEIVKTMAMAVNAIRFGQHAKITWRVFFASLLSLTGCEQSTLTHKVGVKI